MKGTKKPNPVGEKSFAFAVRIVRLYQFLSTEKKEFVMSKQLLRSGTSVGAIAREAENAESKKDFIHKFGIAQKEIGETIYWLELLHETKYMTQDQFESIRIDAVEILKLITAILKSAKSRP